jgi:hypothetical protein
MNTINITVILLLKWKTILKSLVYRSYSSKEE